MVIETHNMLGPTANANKSGSRNDAGIRPGNHVRRLEPSRKGAGRQHVVGIVGESGQRPKLWWAESRGHRFIMSW